MYWLLYIVQQRYACHIYIYYIDESHLEFPKHNHDFHLLTTSVNAKYYYLLYTVDARVLLENNQWHISHILTSEDIDDVIYRFLHWIYIIKRKWHGGLKIWI